MKKLWLFPALCLLCCSCCSKCNDTNNQVKSQQASPDWEITTKVKTEILGDPSISASARFVTVNTTDGVVTLGGSVPTRQDREKIVKMVKKVPGVKRVDDQITISK